ncbi:2'-5' RNA ligase family protein [Acrocarpospora sp. B8E8]|uniref:2'-5' RNA ligase family protein n=1 Tax=Acrocarpospora sp. B8E8 TaxID=3153572 RepID=UPI00325C7E99
MTFPLAADERSFPATPPSDLDDPEVIISNDRRAFEQLDWMKDHWDHDRWHEGYRAYYWMLSFPEAPDLMKLARRCQEALAPLGMDDVPEDGLHITMPKIGDAFEVGREHAERLATAAAGTLPGPFAIRAHPLTASHGAARFTVTPWRALVSLHQALTNATSAAGLPGGFPTRQFRPHLGVSYNNKRRSAFVVGTFLAPLRDLESVSLHISSVDLVELRREDTAYRWDVIASVPLALPARNDLLL